MIESIIGFTAYHHGISSLATCFCNGSCWLYWLLVHQRLQLERGNVDGS